MYGLPREFDGGFLVGRVLEMVCFAQYQVCLHFDQRITITIASAFSYRTDSVVEVPLQESNLMELLGTSVSAAVGDENGTLSMQFSNSQTLRIYDTSKQYESYTIACADKEIIV
jgi:hypothetical protein